jgi:hypothetical protein
VPLRYTESELKNIIHTKSASRRVSPHVFSLLLGCVYELPDAPLYEGLLSGTVWRRREWRGERQRVDVRSEGSSSEVTYKR